MGLGVQLDKTLEELLNLNFRLTVNSSLILSLFHTVFELKKFII